MCTILNNRVAAALLSIERLALPWWRRRRHRAVMGRSVGPRVRSPRFLKTESGTLTLPLLLLLLLSNIGRERAYKRTCWIDKSAE